MNGSLVHASQAALDIHRWRAAHLNTLHNLASCLTSFGTATALAVCLASEHASYHGLLALLYTIRGTGSHSVAWMTAVVAAHYLAATLVHRFGTSSRHTSHDEQKITAKARTLSEDIEPLLFPARTTHRRLFPTPHSFSYSYLLAGIPITRASQNFTGLLSSHSSSGSPAWFSIHASDYLIRGSALSHTSFRQRLDEYLTTQAVNPATLPTAYLVTAPRFLNFSFNPVSFWYLYDRSGHFAAMILEVNNTFDERRMYFLGRDLATDTSETMRFTFSWKKDFHVSPFNDRDGTYSVSAVDVRSGTVDVTIVLRDDQEKPKIVARVYSTSPAGDHVGQGINPHLPLFRRIQFLLRWAWVGFLTNPRILREARTLWVKKLQVFYRPEPKLGTHGRKETPEEVVLEECFAIVLRALAKASGVSIIAYHAAAGPLRGRASTFGSGEGSLSVHVLTPEFYAELARSTGSLAGVFNHVAFTSDEKQRLVWCSNEAVMREMLRAPVVEKGPCSDGAGFMTVLHAVLSGVQEKASLAESYTWVRKRVLLADSVAFGSAWLLALEIRLVRAVAVFLLTGVALRQLTVVP